MMMLKIYVLCLVALLGCADAWNKPSRCRCARNCFKYELPRGRCGPKGKGLVCCKRGFLFGGSPFGRAGVGVGFPGSGYAAGVERVPVTTRVVPIKAGHAPVRVSPVPAVASVPVISQYGPGPGTTGYSVQVDNGQSGLNLGPSYIYSGIQPGKGSPRSPRFSNDVYATSASGFGYPIPSYGYGPWSSDGGDNFSGDHVYDGFSDTAADIYSDGYFGDQGFFVSGPGYYGHPKGKKY